MFRQYIGNKINCYNKAANLARY